MAIPKHERHIVINRFSLAVSREHDQYFMLDEIKLGFGSLTEDEWGALLGPRLADVCDELGSMAVYETPSRYIIVCDHESGVVTKSARPFGADLWYDWVFHQLASGALSIDSKGGTR